MGGSSTDLMPVVNKLYCFSSKTVLMVRKRPPVVNGGGFAVLDSMQQVVFMVDGCGSLGANGEVMLRDGDGAPLLFMRKKGGIVQVLSVNNQWKGYLMDYDGPSKPVFSLREPKAWNVMKGGIRISVEPKGCSKHWDFEVYGSFVDKDCTIKDRSGHVVAQVGVKEMMDSKDFYHVVVQPGYDQAFVFGVMAVLDNIHGESTRC